MFLLSQIVLLVMYIESVIVYFTAYIGAVAESVLVVCSGKLWNIHLLSSIWDGRNSGLELPAAEDPC